MKADGTQNLSPGPQALDEAALLHLLGLAGPSDGPELLRRLIADLREVDAGLRTGLATDDCGMMRKHSHVLMGIAGTIGALHIYQLAQRLNQRAKDDNSIEAAPCAADLIPRMGVLVARLCALSAELGLGG